jgi:hypothetical protein
LDQSRKQELNLVFQLFWTQHDTAL